MESLSKEDNGNSFGSFLLELSPLPSYKRVKLSTLREILHPTARNAEKLSVKQPRLVNRDRIILLHDNASLYVSKTNIQKLNTLQYENASHLPYSLDLSPTDCHFFKHLDRVLVGKQFNKRRHQNRLRGIHSVQKFGFLLN